MHKFNWSFSFVRMSFYKMESPKRDNCDDLFKKWHQMHDKVQENRRPIATKTKPLDESSSLKHN